MASFFKNLFRKDSDSQPVPSADRFFGAETPGARLPVFQEQAEPAGNGLAAGGPRHGGEVPSPAFEAAGLTGETTAFPGLASRGMTARELASLLPADVVRQDGMAPDQPVPLPLAELRQSLNAGRPSLRLSRIQQACPELFSRAVRADEDVEIALPPDRITAILEAGGVNGIPASPAGLSAGGFPPPAFSGPPGNPFAGIPLPSAGVSAPVQAMATPVAPAVPENPFSRVSPLFTPGAVPPASGPLVAVADTGPASMGAAPPSSMAAPVPAPNPFPPESGHVVAPSPFFAVSGAPQAAVESPFAAVRPEPAGQTVELPAVPAPDSAGTPPGRLPVLSTSPFAAVSPPAGGMAAGAPPEPAAVPVTSLAPASSGSPSMPQLHPLPATAWTPPAGLPGSRPVPGPAGSGPGSISGGVPGVPGAAPATGHTGPLPPVLPPPPLAPQSGLPALKELPVLPPLPVSAPVPVEKSALSGPPPLSGPVPPLPAAPPDVPAAPASQPPAAEALMEMSLRAVLRDTDENDLGFAPHHVPEHVRVTLPVDLVSRQLASGRVEAGIGDISEGVLEKFRPAFARAVPGLRIIIPLSEVFQNLPETARPAPPSAETPGHLEITTSPFQTPFAIKAEEDQQQLPDLTMGGFGAAGLRRPRPGPPADLSAAPLPPVPPAPPGAVPPAVAELPVLRLSSSPQESGGLPGNAAPEALPAAPPLAEKAQSVVETPPPLLPRTGMLSRPPGGRTAPTEPVIPVPAVEADSQISDSPPVAAQLPTLQAPRGAPRLKMTSGPVPVTLKPFPKPLPQETLSPPAPPVSVTESGTSILPPFPLTAAMQQENGIQGRPDPGTLSGAAEPSSRSASATTSAAPSDAGTPSGPADDLGESFSAAALSAEPPPRAGSAPVPLPAKTAAVPAATGPASGSGSGSAGPGSVDSGSAPAGPSAAPAGVPVAGLSAGEFASPAAASVPSQLPGAAASRGQEPAGPAPALTRASGSEDLTFGWVSDVSQLTLRAVFGTDQQLSLQQVVERCASLPGLRACALLRGNGQEAFISQGLESGEAAAFRAGVLKTRDSLAVLAAAVGLGDSGNFTLRSDHGVRSFFLEPGLCLAVWHEQPAFSGGTREKLVLISRALAAL